MMPKAAEQVKADDLGRRMAAERSQWVATLGRVSWDREQLRRRSVRQQALQLRLAALRAERLVAADDQLALDLEPAVNSSIYAAEYAESAKSTSDKGSADFADYAATYSDSAGYRGGAVDWASGDPA